ncbi:hypothetical protein GHT06_009187 [Daphnia sinensis]|uniref:Uncharacterized protein n=1 Tax=Daphnia sinensis TaxID=1820382 RepID=A0AAD5Q3E5_9CRUS|nr:hypothetical protein GHT06_009187 [Daphnia sinensis]
MNLMIFLASILAVAVASGVNSKRQTNIQVSPDQDVAEFYRRGFYGGYRGHWRGRRSAVEAKPELEAGVEIADDQDTGEFYASRFYGNYGHPSYYSRYGNWRGRRSVGEVKPEVEPNFEVADQEANEFRRGYYGGHHGYWRGRRSTDENADTLQIEPDQDANENFRRGYYGHSYGRYGSWYGRHW